MNEAMLTTIKDDCPYCGSALELAVDTSPGSQEYTEDCEVCCAPIRVQVHVNLEGALEAVYLSREDD